MHLLRKTSLSAVFLYVYAYSYSQQCGIRHILTGESSFNFFFHDKSHLEKYTYSTFGIQKFVSRPPDGTLFWSSWHQLNWFTRYHQPCLWITSLKTSSFPSQWLTKKTCIALTSSSTSTEWKRKQKVLSIEQKVDIIQ